MAELDSYLSLLYQNDWPSIEWIIAVHLKNKGYALSHVPFLKSVLNELIEADDGPLSGIDPLFGDVCEMMIIEGVVDRLINDYLENEKQ